MSKVEKENEEVFIEELSKFDVGTATNYKTMFERAIKRSEKRGEKRVVMKLVKTAIITKEQAEKAFKSKQPPYFNPSTDSSPAHQRQSASFSFSSQI